VIVVLFDFLQYQRWQAHAGPVTSSLILGHTVGKELSVLVIRPSDLDTDFLLRRIVRFSLILKLQARLELGPCSGPSLVT
jgi:hypothetical protein